MHIKRHHFDLYKEAAPQPKEVTKDKQHTLEGYFSHQTPYLKTSSRFKACDEALVRFICADMQPLSIVDTTSFSQFVQTLDPLYTMHSRSYYTRVAIPRKYEELKAVVKTNLEKSEFMSVTTD